MKNGYRFFYLCLAIILATMSCKKDIDSNQSVSLSNTTSKDGAPNYPFDWETATQMMPSYTNATYNAYLPWTSQSGAYIDPAIISDYKSSDGWVLVYNTFNPTNNYYLTSAAEGGLYFALYNVYRGILRYYLYIPSGVLNGGANIQHGLSIYSGTGATTSMLNFEGSDIVDANNNIQALTKTNNVGVAEAGGWYAMQYEIAYDPNFANASYPNLGIAWNSRIVSISDIQIAGGEAGTITGNITQQSSGTGSTILNGVLGAVEIFGAAYTGSDSFLKMMAGAASNGVAGNITNLLSGIFGGNSNNTQEVDLKMNTTINLTGSIVTPNPLAPNTFVFPGESIAAGNPSYPPLYTSSLGVFNLSNRPTVTESTYGPTKLTSGNGGLGSYTYYQLQKNYTLNTNSFNILWNPAVTSNATITNLKEEVLLWNVIKGIACQTSSIPPNNNKLYSYVSGNVEQFDGTSVPVQTGVNNIYEYYAESNSMSNIADVTQVAVRISFNVVPNNGAPTSTIVKTFLANLMK